MPKRRVKETSGSYEDSVGEFNSWGKISQKGGYYFPSGMPLQSGGENDTSQRNCKSRKIMRHN